MLLLPARDLALTPLSQLLTCCEIARGEPPLPNCLPPENPSPWHVWLDGSSAEGARPWQGQGDDAICSSPAPPIAIQRTWVAHSASSARCQALPPQSLRAAPALQAEGMWAGLSPHRLDLKEGSWGKADQGGSSLRPLAAARQIPASAVLLAILLSLQTPVLPWADRQRRARQGRAWHLQSSFRSPYPEESPGRP